MQLDPGLYINHKSVHILCMYVYKGLFQISIAIEKKQQFTLCKFVNLAMKSTEKQTLSFQETTWLRLNSNHWPPFDQDAQALTTKPRCLLKKKECPQIVTSWWEWLNHSIYTHKCVHSPISCGEPKFYYTLQTKMLSGGFLPNLFNTLPFDFYRCTWVLCRIKIVHLLHRYKFMNNCI